MEALAPKTYIQVGFTAARHPVTREFLPAEPLYIEADENAKASEEQVIADIGQLLALRMKAYRDGCSEAGAAI